MIDPTAMTPKAGAGLPAPTGYISPPLLRPAGQNLAAGSTPSSQSYTGTLYTTNLINDHARRQSGLTLSGGHIAAFGDSNTSAFPLNLIGPFIENYGVAGDTLPGLTTRLRAGNYSALANARAIIWIGPGFNDICVGSPNLSTIQSMTAAILAYFTGPLVIVPPTPTDNATWNGNILTFETWLTTNYAARSQCSIIDISSYRNGAGLANNGVTTDGQHLSGATHVSLAAKIASALRVL